MLRATATLAVLLTACQPSSPEGPTPPDDTLDVAFIYVGPVGDAGWSWSHDQARKGLEEKFPWVDTAYAESVPEGAEAERVLTQYAEKGYELVFATSFGFMDPVMAVAERYPDTVFMHCSGYKRRANVGTYFGRMYQAKYLSGIIAASVSKSHVLGYVAPHPIPEVIRHVDAFALGARSVDPTATVRVVWTNTWFDPGKEKEAALSLIDAGADVVATGADSAAPLQAAQERGVLAIGYDSDNREFAPDAFLTSPIWDWSVVYDDVVQRVHDKTWTSGDTWGGLETGVVGLAPLSDKVPADVKARVEDAAERIEKGELVVFTGPVKRQDGSEAWPEGTVPTDQELWNLDWFVEGVVGSLPTSDGG